MAWSGGREGAMYGYSWLHAGAAEFRIGGYEDFCLSHYFFLFFSFNFSPLELVVGHLFSYSSTRLPTTSPVFCGTRYEKEKGVSSSYPSYILNPA